MANKSPLLDIKSIHANVEKDEDLGNERKGGKSMPAVMCNKNWNVSWNMEIC